jgi:hypothetical protein
MDWVIPKGMDKNKATKTESAETTSSAVTQHLTSWERAIPQRQWKQPRKKRRKSLT